VDYCPRGRKYSFRKCNKKSFIIAIILFKWYIIVEEEERKNKGKVSEEYSSTTSLYQQPSPGRKVSILIEDTGDSCHLAPPSMSKATSSSSNETLTGG